ncbi:MAG: ABC transporter permease [Deltaproteobacteria bacterium]|nr:ABC transporter permease [Deltaproteobacteria bacterium]
MNLAEQMTALQTILFKEFRRFLRIWVQTIVPPVITMSLYFVIFGNLIGSQIGDIHGFRYIQFIVPGLIMMSVITNSYINVCSSFFSTKFQKSVEELLVSPTPDYMIVLGYSLGGVGRGIIVGAVVFGVALFFTELSVYHFGYLLVFSFLTSSLFSLTGLINGICAKKFDDISIIPTFVLTPLTYLGGVFYSTDQLSPFWQGLSRLNPILYMVNGFRYGFLGVSDVDPLLSAVVLAVFILLFFLISLRLLQKGIGLRS